VQPDRKQPRKALHVGVIREGKFIDDRYFAETAQAISAGEAEKNTFALPLSSLPQTQTLFERRGAGYALLLTPEMRGRIELKDRELLLPQKAGELLLTDEAKGRISLGQVTFVFNFALPPPVPKKPVLPKEARGTLWNVTDHTFMTVLAISLAVHGCAIAAISRRNLPPEEAALDEVPDRFAKLLIPDKPPEEEKAPEEKQPEAAPEEEKAPEKREAKKDEPKDSAEHRAAVQKAVAQKGLIKILGSVGSGGSGALANVLAAGGGFSADIGAALAGAGGVAIASEGGPARKGENAAQAAGIGGLATSGGGHLAAREKSDVAVHGSVSSEDAEIDSPTVDKAALSRFINLRKGSIQGCYEQQLKRSPTLRGKLVVRFTIGTRGQILEVSIDQDTLGSDELASCITRLVKAWRLPFTPDADTTVTFPFLFHPG